MWQAQFAPEVEEDVLVEEITSNDLTARLVVYNDDYNTFEWVIECFVEVCGHTHEQAEQLAILIHFKGKATVKTASKKELLPFKDALVDRGLSAVIEEDKS